MDLDDIIGVTILMMMPTPGPTPAAAAATRAPASTSSPGPITDDGAQLPPPPLDPAAVSAATAGMAAVRSSRGHPALG